jgi:Protein of unknown function (DUF2958)
MMTLLTPALREQLLHNGTLREASYDDPGAEPDFQPVVKLFTPDAGCTWLLSELDPGDPDIAFGLCDLGMGCPELGCVRMSELVSVRGPLGLAIERDLHFTARHTLSTYARAAGNAAAITEDDAALAHAAQVRP